MDQALGRRKWMSKLGENASFCDVVVVGAGPAGSASAISCAQAGFDVVLMERDSFPRDHPGETVHPGIEPLLKQLGILDEVLSAGFFRHTGNWIAWDKPLQFVPFGSDENGDDWRGFQLWRAVFDTLMLNHARKLGVRIVQPCQVLEPLVTGNKEKVIGVTTSQGSFKSSFVVDAAGGQHWLARRSKIDVRNHSPRLLAHFGYVRTDDNSSMTPSIVADEQGWTWTAQVRRDLYQWTSLAFDAGAKKKKEAVPDKLRHLNQVGEVRGKDVTWRIASKPAGEGYFMVGDAAAVVDPASSHGILWALMSGMLAGHLIKVLQRGKRSETDVISAYNNWMYSWFEEDTKNLRELYAKHPYPPRWI